MDKSFFTIYKTFFKIGTLLLGGGYVILPLLTSEISTKKGWLTSDELCEYYALSTSLPGVIAINTAVFTGLKLAKIKGAIAATTGIVTPAFLAIILLASILDEIVHLNIVKYSFWGIGIAIITLLCMAICEMWNKSVSDKYTLIIYLTATILTLFFKISPAIIIIGAVIFSVLFQKIMNSRKVGNDD